MQKIRVGVIGVGHLGQHHARIFSENPRCALVGVVDVNEGAATRIAKACRTQSFFDHRRLLGLVDAVSVVVPTPAHYEVAKDFLEAGVHVLVEKPIASNVREARALINLARKHKCILQVGHIERFNAAVRKLRDILTAPKFVECHRVGPYDPRVRDVGVVLDLMIHDLDILLQIAPAPIASFEAVGVPILSPSEDIANVRIKFADGCIANVTASRVTPSKMRKIRIWQDNAYISLDYDRQSMEIYRRVELPQGKDGDPRFEIVRKRIRVKMEDKLALELDHFLDCVEQGTRPLVDGEAATQALELAVQIAEQIRTVARGYFEAIAPKLDDGAKR
ncbi:MAG: Gfo/Idh/MocA family oxidoreductase [Candidatus Sumerlaeota bacterium]|nr:Gfo/Idh/MocA family oxidoreductase [Candidatus Sumerlaeota bacterium]